jgi:hypothetical protein
MMNAQRLADGGFVKTGNQRILSGAGEQGQVAETIAGDTATMVAALKALVAAAQAAAAAAAKTFPGGLGRGSTSAGGQYNLGALEGLWQGAGGPGGGTAHVAGAIALAESGGNPNAFNPSGASGLWQILGAVSPGNLFNPQVNATNAVIKYRDAGGFSPWVTYTTGAYRSFMDRGGWLMPGNTMVTNNTGRPERVLPPGPMTVRLEINAGNSNAYTQFLMGEIKKYVRIAGAGSAETAFGS